jgi:hypothetical protein
MEEEGEAEGDEGGGVRKEEEEEEIGENGEDGEEFSNSQRKRPRLDGVPSFVNAEAVSAISAAAASAITSDAAAPAPVIAKESLLPFALRAAVEDTWVRIDCLYTPIVSFIRFGFFFFFFLNCAYRVVGNVSLVFAESI